MNLANGMAEIHTPDEHIAVADLDAMVDVTLALVDAAREAGVTRPGRAATRLRCPFCRTELEERGWRCGPRLRELRGRAYPVEDGIPHVLAPRLPGRAEKLGEVAGWPEKAKAEGWYEPDDAVDTVLPFPAREIEAGRASTWFATGHSFQVLLDRYVIGERGLRVLEVGAAKCWAAP